MHTLETSRECMVLDDRGRVISFRAKIAPKQEFIASEIPWAFTLQYRRDDDIYDLTSASAESVGVEADARSVTVSYAAFDGQSSALTVTTRAWVEDDSIWMDAKLAGGDLAICGLAYPMIVTRYDLGGRPGSEALLRPFNCGQLIEAPRPEIMEPDHRRAWMFRPENGDSVHYPGQTFAQFLAYYNSEAGIYLSCDDAEGQIKLIKPVHNPAGLRLGMLHAGDWNKRGELGYRVQLRSFAGDWHDAADLYRAWTSRQKWAVPIQARADFPQWMLDSPAHVVMRMKGQIDEGPTQPNAPFLPYEKMIPLLDKISGKIEAPILPVIMSWENKGPWVYPDCFPPAGGDSSLQKFTKGAAARGWHVGSYCNGTRWVTAQLWSGYDGRKFLEERDGAKTFSRTVRGADWKSLWDAKWRESYAQCLGVERTHRIAEDFCARLIGDGLDYVQYLDQNINCATFPCYAKDHGHVPFPDIWMTREMRRLLDMMKRLRKESGRPVAIAQEQPPAELFIPDIDVADVRVAPPNHRNWKHGFFPLYQYLFHEYLLLQGTFGQGQDPYHTQLRIAYNLILGDMVGGVIDGNGEFLSCDELQPWALWDRKVSDGEAIIRILRNATALRRKRGKPYLVFGRMEREADIPGIEPACWQFEGTNHQVPSVLHSAWTSPDGRFAIVLMNWTDRDRKLTFRDCRVSEEEIHVTVPAFDCALVEGRA